MIHSYILSVLIDTGEELLCASLRNNGYDRTDSIINPFLTIEFIDIACNLKHNCLAL
jgi:hypothetical protein